MQPVDLAHEFEIGCGYRARQVIHRAARDACGFGLFRDAQRMTTVDHRLALSNPALMSAPSKKLAWRCSPPVWIETGHCYTPPGRERPFRFWWRVTPLKNLVHGLLRT